MCLLESVIPLFFIAVVMRLWKVIDQREHGHEYVEATSIPLPLYDVRETGICYGLIEKRLENSIEFRGRKIMNDDFSSTLSLLDHDFGA